jgi:branched-chain amino acid transport system ATP-binding protein
MTRLLEVRGVHKHFGGVHAVNDVSLDLDAGQILGLIGPNGAGKTTLFNLISGAIAADTGHVTLEGKDVTGWPAYHIVARGLARTHQIVRPLSEMSVLDNVVVGACFGAERLGLHAARARADEVLRTVGLHDRRDVLAKQLTLGGKKRLEVARALAGQPRLLLLDEVLAGLNPTEIAGMIEVIRKIRDERGLGILMIEHLMQAIMNLSDRILVLSFGAVLAAGTPQEISHDPAVVTAYLGDPELADKLMERK